MITLKGPKIYFEVDRIFYYNLFSNINFLHKRSIINNKNNLIPKTKSRKSSYQKSVQNEEREGKNK